MTATQSNSSALLNLQSYPERPRRKNFKINTLGDKLDQGNLDSFFIGHYQVHPASNELSHGDSTAQLEPKVMALLLMLAETPGATVSRDELFKALWPGVVVSDDTLTQVVIKLRKAFGETAKKPAYIQTVTKRGYRLHTDIIVHSNGNQDSAKLSQRISWRTALIITTLVIAAWIIYVLTELGSSNTVEPIGQNEVQRRNIPTLAVEPFTLLAKESSQAYLADGLTHDLITDLSKLSALWIVSSRSVMGQNTGITTKTSTGYAVSGEVQRSANQIRINVHLRDIASGRELWSERFQRPIDDLFLIQEEITTEIASKLSIRITEAEQHRLSQPYTQNLQAYEYFLRAQSLLLLRLKPENDRARQFYRRAIALDPSFARAYAGLALSYAADYRNQWTKDGQFSLKQARAMARTALQIDPEVPEIYWVLAYVNAQHKQHERAIKLLQKAISIDHSFADAYALLGGIYTYTGYPEKTLDLLRTAIRLNPDAGNLYFLLLGRAYVFQQDWEQALINLREALLRNPVSLEARIYLAIALASSGATEDADWETTEILSLQANFDATSWLDTYPMTDQIQIQFLNANLKKLNLAD